MSGAEWKGNCEDRAAPEFALDADCSAMKLDEFLDQREADTDSFKRSSVRTFDAPEPFE